MVTDTVHICRKSNSEGGERAMDVKSRMLVKIRVTMTLRISQFAMVCGLSVLAVAQTPRYQSPMAVPAQPVTLPTPTPITPNGTSRTAAASAA